RQRRRHLRRHPGIDIGLSLQDEIIGIEAIRPLAPDALDFGAAQARLDRPNDIQSDLVLQRENIVELPVETLAPQMTARARLDHLRRDADTVCVFPKASLQQIAHAELTTDTLRIDHRSFKGE